LPKRTKRGDLAAEWESRLRRLLAADPGVAPELARVVAVLARLLEDQGARPITIRQRVNASDHSTVIQVAGDARIGEVLAGA
jgi:hypothetical protein